MRIERQRVRGSVPRLSYGREGLARRSDSLRAVRGVAQREPRPPRRYVAGLADGLMLGGMISMDGLAGIETDGITGSEGSGAVVAPGKKRLGTPASESSSTATKRPVTPSVQKTEIRSSRGSRAPRPRGRAGGRPPPPPAPADDVPLLPVVPLPVPPAPVRPLIGQPSRASSRPAERLSTRCSRRGGRCERSAPRARPGHGARPRGAEQLQACACRARPPTRRETRRAQPPSGGHSGSESRTRLPRRREGSTLSDPVRVGPQRAAS